MLRTIKKLWMYKLYYNVDEIFNDMWYIVLFYVSLIYIPDDAPVYVTKFNSKHYAQ